MQADEFTPHYDTGTINDQLTHSSKLYKGHNYYYFYQTHHLPFNQKAFIFIYTFYLSNPNTIDIMKNEYVRTLTIIILVVSVILVFLGATVAEAKNSDLKCPIPSGKKYAPYPGSYCVDYYSCDGSDSSALTLSCPGGWMFNDKTQQCASSAEVHCEN